MVQNGSIPMQVTEEYFTEIDACRLARVRELLEIKRIVEGSEGSDRLRVRSKALVVLCYAMWEGFYNDCTEIFCRFLKLGSKSVKDVGWNMMAGVLNSDFDKLRDRKHSAAARIDFVEELKNQMASGFNDFDTSIVMARSNLDFQKLRHNYRVLHFNIEPFQPHRNRIDKEVVGWRNGVAHGELPDLTPLNANRHVTLVANIMILVADSFQQGILHVSGNT